MERNVLMERFHKAKVWATGEKFRTILCFFLLGHVIEDLISKSQEEDQDQARRYFEILKVFLIVFGLKAIQEIIGLMGQMGLLKMKRHQHILDMIQRVGTVLPLFALYKLWYFNDVKTESTRFPQDFCTKGEF